MIDHDKSLSVVSRSLIGVRWSVLGARSAANTDHQTPTSDQLTTDKRLLILHILEFLLYFRAPKVVKNLRMTRYTKFVNGFQPSGASGCRYPVGAAVQVHFWLFSLHVINF